jgi:hypothetical protein
MKIILGVIVLYLIVSAALVAYLVQRRPAQAPAPPAHAATARPPAVAPASPAAAAPASGRASQAPVGLQPGDRIVPIPGRPAADSTDVRRLAAQTRPDQPGAAAVARGRDAVTITPEASPAVAATGPALPDLSGNWIMTPRNWPIRVRRLGENRYALSGGSSTITGTYELSGDHLTKTGSAAVTRPCDWRLTAGGDLELLTSDRTVQAGNLMVRAPAGKP